MKFFKKIQREIKIHHIVNRDCGSIYIFGEFSLKNENKSDIKINLCLAGYFSEHNSMYFSTIVVEKK